MAAGNQNISVGLQAERQQLSKRHRAKLNNRSSGSARGKYHLVAKFLDSHVSTSRVAFYESSQSLVQVCHCSAGIDVSTTRVGTTKQGFKRQKHLRVLAKDVRSGPQSSIAYTMSSVSKSRQ